MRALGLALVTACVGRSYLGAPTPTACAAGDAERCAGWLAERDLDAGELDVYDDPALRAYVQTIADRLAHGSRLVRPPRVVISDHDGTYAPFGERIVIGRITIEKLGSEAELAGIVAHELVHVEGHHATVSLFGPDTDDVWLAARRDAEAVADERAVALLERAGYTPAAMPLALATALPAEIDDSDDEHPPRDERISRVAALAANRTQGFEGRRELLAHVDGMIAGRDTRLGIAVGGAWVVANLGVALELPDRDLARSDGDTLVLRHGRATLDAYPIGAPWAKELASQLDQRASTETALGSVTVGIAPSRDLANAEPLAKLEHAVRASLPQPTPGTWVVILDRCVPHACGGLVIEIATHGDAYVRARWLSGLRAASGRELAAATPVRITLAIAPRAATIRELVATCADPAAALHLDRPDRVIPAGEPFKCTDR